MNGYRTEPRRRFPTQNRHPVDVFSGYDDTEFHQPVLLHQQQQSQAQNSNNTFSPICESSNQGNPGIFYSEYRSGRSSVPAHLLNSSSNNSEPLFNRTHPSPQQQQQRIPFIDTSSDFDYPLTPKQILDTFQKQSSDPWFNKPAWKQAQKSGGEQIFDNNWSSSSSSASSLKPQSNNLQQQDINNTTAAATPASTKVPWRQNFQSISDNHTLLSNRLIDDLLAPYSLETSSTNPHLSHYHHHHQQQQQQKQPNNNSQQQQQFRSSAAAVNFRNPQPYYPYRRPSSALADPFVHSNSNSTTTTSSSNIPLTQNGIAKKSATVDPLRQQNRERIQPLHIRNPANSDLSAEQPRPTHRTFSEPNSQGAAHTLDILSTSLYDPNSSYYSSNRQPQQQQQRQSEYLINNNNNNNHQKSHFSDSDDFLFDSDDNMSKTTANWKNSFAAMRDRFGSKERTPDESNDLPFGFDHSYASNGSLTMPRSRGLLKSASHSTIGKVEPSRSSSLLREAVINRRASEAPDFMQNGSSTFGRRSSETPEPTAKRPLGNFWIETVKNRPTSPSIPRLPYKMTTAAERLEQLHEPIDSSNNSNGNGIDRNQDYYSPPQTNGSYGNVFRKSAPESVIQRRNQFVETYSSPKNNGFADSSTPFPSERYVSERKINGHPNFSSLDNAVADLKQNAEKLFNDSRGCARFPIGEFSPPSNSSPTKRLGIFTGTRISPPRFISTLNGQHSPSPDSLSGESNTSIANLPHPRPKHNIREQLMNAGVVSNTHFGPYMGRRSVTPNFPAPTSGSVASRISVFEKRPGTPTLLQLASASTSADTPEPPRSPLSPRTTVYRTKPVIHMEMNENNGITSNSTATRGGAISPEYDNKHIATVSTSAAFHFPHKNNGGNYSPRWRDDPTDEASPLSRNLPNSTFFNNRLHSNTSTPTTTESLATSTPKINNNRVGTPIIPLSPIGKLNFDNYEDASILNDKSVFATIHTSEPVEKIDLKTTSPLSKLTPSHSTAHSTHSKPTALPPLLPYHSKIAGKLSNVPRFHFPSGKPISKAENDSTLSKIEAIFASRPQQVLRPRDFDEVCRKMSLPVYTKRALYEAVCQCSRLPAAENPDVTFNQFVAFWNELIQKNHDEASRFIFTLAVAKTGLPARTYLEKEDFHSILYDLISTYPGLNFLIDSTLFHARYVEVVVVRIFWNVNRSWSGRITAHELRKSNFLQTMHLLEEIDDINKITDYFSYEHFYVTYCKFWELDYDHDMIISREDMKNHCDGALTNMIIDRIFSNAVNRYPSAKKPSTLTSTRRGPVREEKIETIGFEEFVAFLLAEEDKRHPTSIEYWFRCIDLDGDGIISMYEMELFYNDMIEKIHAKSYETLEFSDVVNQLYDLVSPEDPKTITLRDLKRCGLAHRFFNTFVNYLKYLEQESADGERATVKMNGDKELSDWEKFCAVEYEILLTETEDEENHDTYNLVLDDEVNLFDTNDSSHD